jgi:hypothetical protein
MTFRYSQISQFLRCPRSYRYRYLDGWGEKESRAALCLAVRLRRRWQHSSSERALGLCSLKSGEPTAMFPSNTAMEMIGSACYGMACGLPVITTATNGTAEMTDGVNGLILQDPNDVAGLALRIRRLYEHPEERERIAAQAAVTAAEYTWNRNGIEMRAIFADALRRRREKSDSASERESATH